MGAERAALLDPRWQRQQCAGVNVLIAAGVYQWTPLKDVCLT
jgi:predicted metal-binding membrane protein